MLKRIAIYIIIAMGIGVLCISTSRNMMERISDIRNERDEWWGVHHPVEGDLVGMSYLYYEKKFCKDRQFVFHAPICENKNNINLVVWGDSYTYNVPDTVFSCLSSYQFGRRHFQRLKYHIDTTKRNVLLIEVAERFVLDYFSSVEIYDFVVKEYDKKAAGSIALTISEHGKKTVIDYLFNPNINPNLEYNLFNYNAISGIRKLKAWMTYHFFSRASGDVVVADDNQYLLLKETVDFDNRKSSYHPFSTPTMNSVIKNLNDIYEHYIGEGFDEVYLSVIPNPATVLQPAGYNNMIPALQTDTSLHIKLIDIYKPFVQTAKEVYWHGDTHWNDTGANMWIEEVNKMLEKRINTKRL